MLGTTSFILWILASGLLPIFLLAAFTNPYTAYPSMIILFLLLVLVQSKNHSKRPEFFDDRVSLERMNRAIDKYVLEVKNGNVED